jgi:hypothetical protein
VQGASAGDLVASHPQIEMGQSLWAVGRYQDFVCQTIDSGEHSLDERDSPETDQRFIFAHSTGFPACLNSNSDHDYILPSQLTLWGRVI